MSNDVKVVSFHEIGVFLFQSYRYLFLLTINDFMTDRRCDHSLALLPQYHVSHNTCVSCEGESLVL